MAKLTSEKANFLEELLVIYKQEVHVLYAVAAAWNKLQERAKDICAEDFDKSIIARETLLEELDALRSLGIKIETYENALFETDQILLKYSGIAKELYGMDVKVFLTSKVLPKSKK